MKIDMRKSSELIQGPSLKNRALLDVEYVLFSIVYEDISVRTNALGHWLVTCPDGKVYNVTCALRNANLEYFKLSADDRALWVALKSQDLIESTKISRQLAYSAEAILQAEEQAISSYTSDSEEFNALLRGPKPKVHKNYYPKTTVFSFQKNVCKNTFND